MRIHLRRLFQRTPALLIAAGTVVPLFAAPAAAAPTAATGDPVTPMVVGGTDPTEAYPFIVSLQQPNKNGKIVSWCGGALIEPDAVLTAAHCGQAFKAGYTTVRVGSPQWAEGGQTANIIAIDVHPGYDPNVGVGNDLAVMRLDRKVTDRTIKPIEIATSEGKVGDLLRVIGFGATCNYGSPQWPCYPAGLQQADLRHVDDNLCSFFDRSVELCTKGDDGRMACFGDSGGPLLKKIHGRWQVVGVVRGDGDADQSDLRCSDGLGVFTDATKYRSWIYTTATRRLSPVPPQQDAVTAFKRPTEPEGGYTFPVDPATGGLGYGLAAA